MTVNPLQFPWLAVIQKRAKEAPKGAVIVFDAQKKQVLIEWSLVQLVSAECLEIKKTLVDLGVAQTVPAELAFIKENPEAVETDGFLRACAPFFKQGVNAVDWNACAKSLGAALRTIYTSDISAFGEEIAKRLEHDMVLFVTAKDVVNDDLLGFVLCGVTPESALGDVKIISLVVDQYSHNQGVERLLLSGVLKALPAALRLFACVRPTNTDLIIEYQRCGFEEIELLSQDSNHPLDPSHWTLLAYDVMLKGRL